MSGEPRITGITSSFLDIKCATIVKFSKYLPNWEICKSDVLTQFVHRLVN